MRRILVIDDERDIRDVLRLSLELLGGWTVTTGQNASEGISLARTLQPDAILMDFMMPDMDGTVAARALHADDRTAGIPILLLTAKPIAPGQADAFVGISGILRKPFDPATLHVAVAEALGWSADR